MAFQNHLRRKKRAAVRVQRAVVPPSKPKETYRADFLWPHDEESVEQAGYEFANAKTEAYRKEWWGILLTRARRHNVRVSDSPGQD